MRIESLIYMVSATQKAAAAAQRIYEILDRVPSVAEPVRPVHPGRLEGAVELRGVRFKYGTREVLHGIDLEVPAGELTMLVGPSGCGKTTLISIIAGILSPTKGTVETCGKPITLLRDKEKVAFRRKSIGRKRPPPVWEPCWAALWGRG